MMKKALRRKTVFGLIGIGVAIFLTISGCANITSVKKSATKTGKGAIPSYYDFGDILIPKELKIKKKLTFIYRTPGFMTGVITLTGRVEIDSLVTFFENNMAKDNWRKISSFKSPRTIILFQKENRFCVINIIDGELEARVNIWVSPTIGESESGLLKQ
ncbi:MAG: hypothetical protein QF888_08900 [Desulfobacterales bacterium]|jgi:hypothetical protein|nr:hypothetical protein [Desulfobacterales bacterium]MDP7418097.1 hypothetical protein [Desulfobacterales bacterium]HJO61481.1 hypothetical protein [Desulfobacterales bacterium]